MTEITSLSLFELIENNGEARAVDLAKRFGVSSATVNATVQRLKKDNSKLGFYLVGDVGVGKTMILNFFFDGLKEKKMSV